ncbi:hypothetical protein [Streptomyces sp. NPDC060027]|uniref:hypothetical protein n=1 Tax=Streptomyces sp. NPDC060027 TaxID=3347040 RepID=UPI0036C4A0AA
MATSDCEREVHVPPTSMFSRLGRVWARGRIPAACVLLLLLFVSVLEVDAALGRIEAPGYPAATLGGLQLDATSQEARENRRTAWCVWTETLPDATSPTRVQGTSVDKGPADRVNECLKAFRNASTAGRPVVPQTEGEQARQLIRVYVALDLFFVALYTFLFLRAVRRLRGRLPLDPDGSIATNDPVAASLATGSGWPVLLCLAGLLCVVELFEDYCQLALSWHGWTPHAIDRLGDFAGLASCAKWALIVLALMLLGMLIVRTRVLSSWGRPRYIGLIRLQAGLAAVLLLLLTGFGMDQVQDALLALPDRAGTALWTPVAALVFALLLWRSVHRTALTADQEYRPVPQGYLALLAALALVGGLCWLRLRAPAALLAFIVVLSALGGAAWRFGTQTGERGFSDARKTARGRAKMIPEQDVRRAGLLSTARLLAALPLLALGVFAVRAAVATAVVGPHRPTAIALAFCGLACALTGIALPAVLKWAESEWSWAKPPTDQDSESQPPTARDSKSQLYTVLAVFCVVFVGVSISTLADAYRWSLPAHTGPLAVLTFFLCVLLVLLNELQRWSERATPVAGFRLLGLRRTPVFSFLLVWFLLASFIDAQGSHLVRVTVDSTEAGPADLPDLAEQFDQWLDANCATAPAKGPLPLVVVAASGGGVRAAYWTAGVLDKLFPPTPITPARDSGCDPTDGRAPVFAVSGISGGSLGAISWIARPRTNDSASHRWVFGADHLSAPLAWMTYVDLPRSFIGFPGKDRAAVLEQSWEGRQRELKKDFYATWQRRGPYWNPLALLNGTAIESGCRVLTAPVRLGAFDRPVGPTSCARRPEDGTHGEKGGPTLIDLRGGFLCGRQDVRRSTAALLSARFPYITPSGRLSTETCDETVKKGARAPAWLSVVDGGYVEGTGSLTAVDLFNELKPLVDCHNQVAGAVNCGRGRARAHARKIELVLVQIDNGYSSVASETPPGRPHELFVPIKGLFRAYNTKDASARQRAFEAFGCGNYLRLPNVRGPGAQAPLGWSLSDSAKENLDQQLRTMKDARGSRLTLAGQRAEARARCQ